MFYEPAKNDHGLPHDPLLAVVSPRPIGWISTLSAAGALNLAPYSFFNIFSRYPAIVGFSSNGRKDSIAIVEETREFVCNLATWDLIDQVNLTSATVPLGIDEMALAGLTAAPSRFVKPPRVAESPCALECKWTETVMLKSRLGTPSKSYLVLGEVIGVHIDDACIVDGRLDVTRTRTLSRCGYLDYSSVESLKSLPRPSAGDLNGARQASRDELRR